MLKDQETILKYIKQWMKKSHGWLEGQSLEANMEQMRAYVEKKTQNLSVPVEILEDVEKPKLPEKDIAKTVVLDLDDEDKELKFEFLKDAESEEGNAQAPALKEDQSSESDYGVIA